MALTTAQIVRGRLNDPYRQDSEVFYGDGSASSFKLSQGAPYSVLSANASAHIYVPAAGNTGWSATGSTIDTAAGTVTFSGTISANSAFMVGYAWAVFGEADMEYFTGKGGIPEATLEGVNWLMGNAWKRARWVAPDGSEYDDRQAMRNLALMRSALRAELTDDLGPEGGIESWSYQQKNY